MIKELKHNCSNNQFNQQTENINIELEKLNENLEALIFKLNSPIVRELNTTTELKIKRIITSTTSYTPNGHVIGDTWTGTLAFESTNDIGYCHKYVINGDDVKALIIETED